MISTHIRKQGGAAVITIPANLMKMLDLQTGTTVELNTYQGQLIVRPVRRVVRKHYSLKELMRGVTPKIFNKIKKNTDWFRELPPMGRELT